ncbi:MAG: RDD family protein, partial [Actinobacteria bacterium]|nr:RDD family protein [Actinomycetota bacterium]
VWNHGYLQGTTGSSLGKRLFHFQVIDEKTSEPIGFGRSVVRQLAHLVDAVPVFAGYLFPLWDAKRQTLADKIMSTVCVPTR